MAMSWALPVTWPAAVYSLEVGIVGTTGVLTIDDTHRDIVLAVSKPQSEGYNPDTSRLVDFMGITEKTTPSARRKLACASFRATHRTIFSDSISFITLI